MATFVHVEPPFAQGRPPKGLWTFSTRSRHGRFGVEANLEASVGSLKGGFFVKFHKHVVRIRLFWLDQDQPEAVTATLHLQRHGGEPIEVDKPFDLGTTAPIFAENIKASVSSAEFWSVEFAPFRWSTKLSSGRSRTIAKYRLVLNLTLHWPGLPEEHATVVSAPFALYSKRPVLASKNFPTAPEECIAICMGPSARPQQAASTNGAKMTQAVHRIASVAESNAAMKRSRSEEQSEVEACAAVQQEEAPKSKMARKDSFSSTSASTPSASPLPTVPSASPSSLESMADFLGAPSSPEFDQPGLERLTPDPWADQLVPTAAHSNWDIGAPQVTGDAEWPLVPWLRSNDSHDDRRHIQLDFFH